MGEYWAMCSNFVVNADIRQKAVGWTWTKKLGMSAVWNTQTYHGMKATVKTIGILN